VIIIGFPVGFVVRECVQAGRDQFGGTSVLDLNAPTAVRFYHVPKAWERVMAGLVPAIHDFCFAEIKTWMAGTRPGMTAIRAETTTH
jgi:hypothetical protein